MGVMSRRVLPACGNLCCFCPSLRARSRQPVKRYKKLISDIFPKSQYADPNDRLISKLCEYASKNPMRIPKIVQHLEQRWYKELRNGKFFLAKVVPYVHRKLLASCKEQIPLYATSTLGIVRTLLDQTSEDEMRTLGCLLLVDFLNCQVDGTYMFNVEGFIPKLCKLGLEMGESDRELRLRAAGLQALASMVLFMGKYSHISEDFDDIVFVALDNYELRQIDRGVSRLNFQESGHPVQLFGEAVNVEDQVESFEDSWTNLLSRYQTTVAVDVPVDVSKSPAYWSRICLHNMATLAQEASTVRRVLEPLFRRFDSGNYWSPKSGIAYSVLSELQVLLEKIGQNSDLMLSTLMKHLDHKNVARQIHVQVNIIKVATHLGEHASSQASLSIITCISDLIRHLRKCFQFSIEASGLGDDSVKWNSILHFSIEECLTQLIKKVGDAGPIFDIMATLLENLPANKVISRAAVSSVYRTAQLVTSICNFKCQKKGFPEALFHQLLLAMAHPDNETRVGCHRIISAIVVPMAVSPWSIPFIPFASNWCAQEGTLVVALSGFSSSEVMLEKLRSNSFQNESLEDKYKQNHEVQDVRADGWHKHNIEFEGGAAYSSKVEPNGIMSVFSDPRGVTKPGEEVLTIMRLSSHQVGLLLSSIWIQATSPANTPANYEALAHTYCLILLLSRVKNSGHVALVRCFQLAFSLRSIALGHENSLQPSHRRSLYTLASTMLLFSATAGNIPEIVSAMKSIIMDNMVSEQPNPHFHLVEDGRRLVLFLRSSSNIDYGSKEDEIAALRFLDRIETDDKQLKEAAISHLIKKFKGLPEEKLVFIKEQTLQEFSPDDALQVGVPLFMETPYSFLSYAKSGRQSFTEAHNSTFLDDEDPLPEVFRNQADSKLSDSVDAVDVLSVNQLIESVLETAQKVANITTSTNPVPYDQMKSQCEALILGKQQKMSVLRSFKNQQVDSKPLTEETNIDQTDPIKTMECQEAESKIVEKEHMRRCDSLSSESEHSFRLPPASPYDKFLKAAGW